MDKKPFPNKLYKNLKKEKESNMKNSKVLKTILFLVGLNLIVMGIWRVTNPVGFYAFSGIILGGGISNLNEARGAVVRSWDSVF